MKGCAMAFNLRLLNLTNANDQAIFRHFVNSISMDMEGGEGIPVTEEAMDKSIRLFCETPTAYSFVGIADGNAVSLINAFKIISSWKGVFRLNLHDLVVDAEYRGQGYGKATLHALDEWCMANNIPQQTLEASAKNEKAIALYEAMGFKHDYFYMKKLLPLATTPEQEAMFHHA
jgi:GNAT superfamily N-acetyltransferase